MHEDAVAFMLAVAFGIVWLLACLAKDFITNQIQQSKQHKADRKRLKEVVQEENRLKKKLGLPVPAPTLSRKELKARDKWIQKCINQMFPD